MSARIAKTKKNEPKARRVFGSGGVFYSFLEGETGPIEIRFDFGSIPAPLVYYYANSLRLNLDEQQRMVVLSFGRRDQHADKFADRIDIGMPAKALFGQFWGNSLPIQDTVDQILQAAGPASKIQPVAQPESEAMMFFANVIFAAVGDGESNLDFYHLSPREVHLAKTQKKDIHIQPVVRVIMSSVLTKYFFETLRPHAQLGQQPQPVAERSKRVLASH